MSDCVFGFKGRDFVVLAADGTVEFSIVKFKETEDKITVFDDDKAIAAAGSQAERTQLMDYLQKNVHLYRLRNSQKLSTKATAHFVRSEMARFLRSSPFQVNMLIAGASEKEGPRLYYVDYLAALQEVSRAAHGYGAYFVLGLLDRYWKSDLTESEAIEIMKLCVREIRTRFLLDRNNFVIKIINNNGITILDSNSL